MNWLPTVDDPKVKGSCCLFSIDNNGIVSGYKIGKGCMECPNRERSTSCAIGFASDTPFHDMEVGTLNNISLVMERGLLHATFHITLSV